MVCAVKTDKAKKIVPTVKQEFAMTSDDQEQSEQTAGQPSPPRRWAMLRYICLETWKPQAKRVHEKTLAWLGKISGTVRRKQLAV